MEGKWDIENALRAKLSKSRCNVRGSTKYSRRRAGALA
jgi:hypothetical protein